MIVRRSWASAILPAAILALAHQLVPLVPALPASLAGLQTYGPLFLLAVAAAVALGFRRGRIVFAVLMLAIAYAGYLGALKTEPHALASRALFAGLLVFIPLNFAGLALLKERGVFNQHGLLRGAVLAGECAFVAWAIATSQSRLIELAHRPFFQGPLLPNQLIPDLGFVALCLAGLVIATAWWRTRSPLNLGLLGALAAFAAAAGSIDAPPAPAAYLAAGALILAIAVLQDSFRMAFRDALTGLPSRRALEERLAGLGRRYTIAMVDVDHFKRFNDTYGHDLGDQVLKVVAAQLGNVSGGGTAYRYGGEEFTVLFPSRSIAQALPHLEALRRQIAGYAVALRSADRPAKAKSGRKRRGTKGGAKTVSVTVSIGVAERSDRLPTASDVVGAADRALYRAKNKGRNQVSR